MFSLGVQQALRFLHCSVCRLGAETRAFQVFLFWGTLGNVVQAHIQCDHGKISGAEHLNMKHIHFFVSRDKNISKSVFLPSGLHICINLKQLHQLVSELVAGIKLSFQKLHNCCN